MTRVVTILGATSAIAEAYTRRLAGRGVTLVLVGRRTEALEGIALDLRARGAQAVHSIAADLANVDNAEATWARILQPAGPPDELVIAYGILGDQAAADEDATEVAKILGINLVSTAVWLNLAARDMRHGPDKRIIAISSVAGDRGRQSNYVYGAAKAGLNAVLEGLAHRLYRKGTKVVTVKPGPVDTPMTAHMAKDGALWTTAARVAEDIDKGVQRGRRVVYSPWFWRPIMLCIRHAPRPLFYRTKL